MKFGLFGGAQADKRPGWCSVRRCMQIRPGSALFLSQWPVLRAGAPGGVTKSRNAPTLADHVMQSASGLDQLGLKLRERLIQIGDESVVGDLEDRRLFIFVDRDDHF
jgi:hypothetical protein